MDEMKQLEIDPEKVGEKIKGFIQGKVEGFHGVVLGLSGGLDSTVCAELCRQALGGDRVLGLLLPDERQKMEGIEKMAEGMKIEHRKIEIGPVRKQFQEASDFFADKKTLGNLKARVRMCFLYGVANSENRLVIGSGNKSEWMVGYFTRWGDGGVDILPLGGLYKTQVKQLAEWLEIPEEVISKEPSAGLWEGQTDRKELGMGYRKLDRILFQLVDRNQRPEEVRLKGVSKEEVEKVVRMVKKSEYKRKGPEICEI